LKTFEIYFVRVFRWEKRHFHKNFTKNIKKAVNGLLAILANLIKNKRCDEHRRSAFLGKTVKKSMKKVI